MRQKQISLGIAFTIFSIAFIIAAIVTRDSNKYADMATYYDYKYLTNLLSEYEEGTDSYCETKEILEKGFYVSKEGVITKTSNFIELLNK